MCSNLFVLFNALIRKPGSRNSHYYYCRVCLFFGFFVVVFCCFFVVVFCFLKEESSRMPVVLAEAVPGVRIEEWETTKAMTLAAEAVDRRVGNNESQDSCG